MAEAADGLLFDLAHTLTGEVEAFADFIEGYGCSGVAFHTAGTVAGVEVAAELFGQQVGGNQHAADL